VLVVDPLSMVYGSAPESIMRILEDLSHQVQVIAFCPANLPRAYGARVVQLS